MHVPLNVKSQWLLEVLSLEAKQQQHEFDHSPPSTAEVKSGDRVLTLIRLQGKHSDNFTFTFTFNIQ